MNLWNGSLVWDVIIANNWKSHGMYNIGVHVNAHCKFVKLKIARTLRRCRMIQCTSIVMILLRLLCRPMTPFIISPLASPTAGSYKLDLLLQDRHWMQPTDKTEKHYSPHNSLLALAAHCSPETLHSWLEFHLQKRDNIMQLLVLILCTMTTMGSIKYFWLMRSSK